MPLVGITPLPGDNLVVTAGGESRTLEPAVDYVAATKHVDDEVEVEDAEFVFVGYGARAPEYDWDDFGDTDVSGKILLFLVNDPPLDDVFGGPAMTYYGRWTYKHEIAAELGAAGSLVIHETGPAGHPWEVVGSTPYAESFDLVAADDNLSRATFEGWVQRATAESLFEMAGLDFEEAKQQAADRAFEPIPLGVTGSLRVRNELRRIDSQNVVARIEGSDAPEEVVMYVAHWDHLGVDPSLEGDGIFNGAADNATGTAGLIELARAFMHVPEPPRRSVLFLAVTAEEQGLLGSRHYGENPLYPAAQTVAALNMDVPQPVGADPRHDHRRDGAIRAGRRRRRCRGAPRTHAGSGPRAGEGLLLPVGPLLVRQGGHSRVLRRSRRRVHRQAGGLRDREAHGVHRERLPQGVGRGEAGLGPVGGSRGPDLHVPHGCAARGWRRVARVERDQRVSGDPGGAAAEVGRRDCGRVLGGVTPAIGAGALMAPRDGARSLLRP